MGKETKMRKFGKFDASSSETVCRIKRLTIHRKVPSSWTTMWSEHYLSAVGPMGCKLACTKPVWPLQLRGFWGKI